MLRNIFLWCGFLPAFYLPLASAQQRPLDTAAYNYWPMYMPSSAQISPDGKFVAYQVGDSRKPQLIKLSVQAASNRWQMDLFHFLTFAYFTNDSKRLIAGVGHDSLAIVTLGTSKVRYIDHVAGSGFTLAGNALYYLVQAGNLNDLMIESITNQKITKLPGIISYDVDQASGDVIFQRNTPGQPDSVTLSYFDHLHQTGTTIWRGSSYNSLTFSPDGTRIAFFGAKSNDQSMGIWFYQRGEKEAIKIADEQSVDSEYKLTSSRLKFSTDGSKLFVQLESNQKPVAVSKDPGINIWHYRDKFNPTEQLTALRSEQQRKITGVLDIAAKKIVAIDHVIRKVPSFENTSGRGNCLLEIENEYPDSYYDVNDRPGFYLTDIRNGLTKLIARQSAYSRHLHPPLLSPGERFVTWYDSDYLCYCSYEIGTGVTRNISKNIPEPIVDTLAVSIGRQEIAMQGIAGYWGDDRFLLVYSKYDIWKVDQLGKLAPVNLTKGEGKAHGVVLSLCDKTGNANKQNGSIDTTKTLILGAYDPLTKQNGFWMLDQRSHQLLPGVLGNYDYYIGRTGFTGGIELQAGEQPVKAGNKPVYIVQRMSAAEAPNLFMTADFKSYQRITNVDPAAQLHYNWLTSELVSWKRPDGELGQGILYKPQNFDPKKKYPVIFTYYEKRSDQLNEYLRTDYAWDRMDIPTYVSNGYLVFVPDIVHYRQGHNGEDLVGAVVSAVEYLGKMSYIDTAKLGLMGHSFGGWETNYLVTHTHLFKAAFEACGVSDQVSAYNELSFGDHGSDRHQFYEVSEQGSPMGIGNTPWTRPDYYLDNSPVFNVGYVTTPLLMMHNRGDGAVPYIQGIELFMAMKRAGKKAWMLEYDGDGHAAVIHKKDYTLRMRQFFDYYLKGAPAPKWMVEGIPAEKKNIEDGLELEPGKTP